MADTCRTDGALVVRTDTLDYPTAWAIQKDRGTRLDHHPRCSSVPGWDPISGPGFLCDCGAIVREWERICGEHQPKERDDGR